MSRKTAPLLIVFIVLYFVHSASAGIVTGPIVNPANGHSYYLLNSASWTISESEAENLGGTLTTINDAAENTWVFDTFAPTADSKGYDLWIGYYDPDTDDGTGAQHAADFIWIDGETPGYTNWSAGEPNGDPELSDQADYTAMTAFSHDGLTPGEWNDKSNTSSTTGSMGVVEVVPEPLSLGIACAVGLLSLSFRPRAK
jgi:hypothetical protein